MVRAVARRASSDTRIRELSILAGLLQDECSQGPRCAEALSARGPCRGGRARSHAHHRTPPQHDLAGMGMNCSARIAAALLTAALTGGCAKPPVVDIGDRK